jgi:hypothetical protein
LKDDSGNWQSPYREPKRKYGWGGIKAKKWPFKWTRKDDEIKGKSKNFPG